MGQERQPYLYFVFSRARAEDLARHLGKWLRKPLTTKPEQLEIRTRIKDFLQLPGADSALTPDLEQIYQRGVAFHHAGLHVMLKSLVEQLYEAKLIKVLYCTGTFALGINMPARAAVFDSLRRYDGQGMIPLPTREFMQMAGRAGRRGLDSEGIVVMRMDLDEFGETEQQIKGYLGAEYEPVHSRFSLSFNSVVNLLHRHPIKRIQRLIEKSFLSWHRQNLAAKERQSASVLSQKIQDAGFDIDAKLPNEWHKQRKKMKKLTRRATRHENASWQEFEERIEFLQIYDYLDPDMAFNAGAKALMHFQIQEIFTTELFLEGIFDELSAPMLYAVCCAMCLELPRGTMVYDAKKHRGFSKRIQKIARSDIVTDASYLVGLPVIWDPTVLPLGKAWAEGKPLSEIMLMFHSNTDISGSLVSGFRRAKDLLNQLRGVWIDFPEKMRMLKQLLKDVSRDEVEVID
jgi:superfamily II RNA helicase